MPLLTLTSVSLAFGHLPLFERANLQVEPGERIALIGRNGTGKSTLLRVISGEIPADGGLVWRSPGLRVSRLDQDVPQAGDRSVFDEVAEGLGELGALVADYHHAAMDVASASVAGSEDPALRNRAPAAGTTVRRPGSPDPGAGSSDIRRPGSSDPGADALARLGDLQHALEERDGWRLEQKVEMIVSRLSLPADRSMTELSGGWRRRALLGKALVSEPDLLLLDEPTNHLDIDAIRWLEDYLRTYTGALLFVTHDRAFLSALATRIVELDRGTLTSWPGSYENFLQKKADALETEARDLTRLDKKLAQEEAWLRQGVKARRTRNEGRVKALHALRAQRAAYRAESGTARMGIDAGETSGRLVFEAEGVAKSYDGVPIVRDYSQRILRGDRMGLIGPNGSGKTTVLRLLVGEIEPDAGTIRRGTRLHVTYFDQQRQQLDPERTVVDSVSDSDTVIVNGQPRHVMGYLADFMFPRERARSPVKSLSGGERNRLLLARLFARPSNVLVMDEPTNDLDIETLELLEELIADFDGTVLLVSHDRVFLDNIVTSTLAFEGNARAVEYVGGYEDYVRQKGASESTSNVQQPTSKLANSKLPNAKLPNAKLPNAKLPNAELPNAKLPNAELPNAKLPNAKLPNSKLPNSKGPTSKASGGETRRKLSFKEQRELDALPAHIAALEAEQQRLETESESLEFYKAPADHIRAVLARLAAVARELEAALSRWMELEERS